MPEHESHLVGMTVVRFLRFMGEMCGLPGAAALERAHEVLFYVGLGEVRYRKVETPQLRHVAEGAAGARRSSTARAS